jgi:hypothetical protein
MEELKNKIRTARPHITDSSLNIYVKNVMKIMDEVFELPGQFDIKYIRKFNIIRLYLEKKYDNEKSRRNYYNSLVVTLMAYKTKSYVMKKFVGEIDKLNVIINAQYDSHEMSEKERQNFVKWEEVLIRRNELLKEHEADPENIEKLQNYLILSLYSYIPPIRNDYGGVVIWNDSSDSDKNYLDMKKKIILLQSYKTVKKYGVKILTIPDVVIDIILKLQKLRKSKFLLTNINGGMLGSNLITNRLNKIFGKKVSTSILRKSFISYTIGYDEDKQKLRIKLAEQMLHSPGVAEGIYNKNLN